MRTFVIDASVGVKWLLPAGGEPFAAEAHRLLNLYMDNRVRLLVPDLFWAEIGNALWKAVIRGRITAHNASEALEGALSLELPSTPASDLIASALLLALAHHRTVYDSVYVAAAMRARTDLITADEKLANALATRFPVRWLGGLTSFL